MTPEEVRQEILAWVNNDKEGQWDDVFYCEGQVYTGSDVLRYICVLECFGGEGKGDHTHIVLKALSMDEGDLYFYKIDGFYSSWDANPWDGELVHVQPVQKLVTVYEPVSA